MKNYKDDLNHFKLDEHQIAQLKYQVKTKKTSKHRSKILLPMGISILAVLLILYLIPKPNVLHHAISYVSTLPIDTETKIYQPQNYDWLMGGGFSVKIDTSKRDQYRNTYEKVKELPIYQYQKVDIQSGEVNGFQDQTYQERITFAKQLLHMDGEIQPSSDDNMKYYIEDHEKVVSVKADAAIDIQYKQEVDQTVIYDSEQMLQLAKQYQDIYKQTRNVTSPVYHVIEYGSSLEVLITQKSEHAPVYEEGNQAIHFTIKEVVNHAYPCIVLPYQENLKVIKTLPLIDKEEAENILLQGGYYYFTDNPQFKREDIIGYDVLYPTLTKIRTFLPYRLPVYRFYILKENGIYYFDVLAIAQEDYESLMDESLHKN